jgi:hypothetical protein
MVAVCRQAELREESMFLYPSQDHVNAFHVAHVAVNSLPSGHAAVPEQVTASAATCKNRLDLLQVFRVWLVKDIEMEQCRPS